MSVLVLGAGKMTSALLAGLSSAHDLSGWQIYSPSGVSAAALAASVGARAVGDLQKVEPPQWVLLGCKPQQLAALAMQLNGQFQNCLYVSMLAAIPEQVQRAQLGAERLIRIMPNIPVRQREGVTLLSSLSANDELKTFQQLFSSVGMALVVKENELEELTLLTGSGPAFIYEFAKDLAASFSSLSPAQREILAVQVLYGAALGAHQEKKPLSDKIAAVTSTGGVTIAVLEKWRQLGLKRLIGEGIAAGLERSRSIRESYHRK